MTQIRSILTRANALAAAGVLVFAMVLSVVIPASEANALSLLSRSLTVTSTVASDDTTAPDGSTYTFDGSNVVAGDSRNGQKVGHTYQFNVQTGGNIEGFTFEYCDTAFGYLGSGACAGAPSGFDTSEVDAGAPSITVRNDTTATDVTFDTVTSDAANFLTVADATNTGVSVSAGDTVIIDFSDAAFLSETNYFTNPDTAYKNGSTNGTYFAHIYTYDDDTNATAAFVDGNNEPTGFVDDGTVTNNVTESISILTKVQETLNFSVEGDEANDGATDPDPGSTGTCDPLTADGDITMGDSNDALDPNTEYTARSYFRLATNSSNGTTVYFSGRTLESGADDIDALTNSATASTTGTEQFGLGLDSGDTGETWNYTLSNLSPVAAFSDAANDNYAYEAASFDTPEPLATSAGIVDCETGSVKYVANIAVDTPAGIYTTKINYIAAPTY